MRFTALKVWSFNLNMTLNRRQFIAGFGTLSIGVLFYYLFRGSDVYFLSFLNHKRIFFDAYGFSSLPTFFHIFSFIMLTACVFNSINSYVLVTFIWLIICSCFELGQKWKFETYLDIHIVRYFTNGVYDPLDMLSIAFGAVVALVCLVLTAKKEGRNAGVESV
jgi:hypothetical protein